MAIIAPLIIAAKKKRKKISRTEYRALVLITVASIIVIAVSLTVL